MSKKVKKQASSLSFSLSRWFRRASAARYSTLVFPLAIVSFTIFLFAGGMYILTTPTQPSVYTGQGFEFIVKPSLISGGSALGDQFSSETIITSALFAFGLVGLLTVYRSTKYTHQPRQAYMTFIVGVTLLLLAYLLLEFVLGLKLYG